MFTPQGFPTSGLAVRGPAFARGGAGGEQEPRRPVPTPAEVFPPHRKRPAPPRERQEEPPGEAPGGGAGRESEGEGEGEGEGSGGRGGGRDERDEPGEEREAS